MCRTHDVIYISDEVQTGFGKCGTLFGYQRSNARPDILTCSKAWGGGLPLAFVLYSSRLGGLPHSGTFRGNQMALHLELFAWSISLQQVSCITWQASSGFG